MTLGHFYELRDRIVKNVTNRFNYAKKDDMFTFASLLDPNYGITWMPKDDQIIWLAKFEALMINEEDNININ